MVVDSLNNCKLYEEIHKDFAKVFEAFKKIKAFETEKIILDEGNVWINAPAATNPTGEHKTFEAHRNFIDIHYIMSGSEAFGYSNIERLKTTKEYDQNKDCERLDGEQEFITLNEGDFCIVYPQDAHIPAYKKIGDKELVRVVAKIRL